MVLSGQTIIYLSFWIFPTVPNRSRFPTYAFQYTMTFSNIGLTYVFGDLQTPLPCIWIYFGGVIWIIQKKTSKQCSKTSVKNGKKRLFFFMSWYVPAQTYLMIWLMLKIFALIIHSYFLRLSCKSLRFPLATSSELQITSYILNGDALIMN